MSTAKLFKIINDMSVKYSVNKLCKMIGVSRSGYYKWLNRKDKSSTLKDKENEEIKQILLDLHKKYRGTYGRKRLCLYLNKLGYHINHKRVYRLMKELKIQSVIRQKVYKRKFKPSTVAENLLSRNFKADKPLQKLCMDITYIPTGQNRQRFIYMNAVKDLYNDEIIAYDLSIRNDTMLVQNTLNKLLHMELDPQCILHTDQGFQYTRKQYSNQLKAAGITQSMSRRGNCWDNAPIEIFFGHLKRELIYLIDTNDISDIETKVHEYIKFYNEERIQEKYNGMSPVEYRTHAR